MMDGMWGGMWFGAIFWLVLLGVIVWAAVTIANKKSMSGPGEQSVHREDALEIVKKRYSRGEITREQFEQMKQDLQS